MKIKTIACTVFSLLFAACAAQPAAVTTVPALTSTPAAVEISFIGFDGGPLTAGQLAFNETEKGKSLTQAYEDYANYLKDTGYWDKDTQISLIPMMDMKDPKNLDKAFYVGVINTDPAFTDKVFTPPLNQVMRYLETGDVNQLAPPAVTTELQPFTEPVFFSKQVTEGSVPAQNGIELGSVFNFSDQEFVYASGPTVQDLEITGHLDENFQWVIEVELTPEQQVWKDAVPPTGIEYKNDGTVWDVEKNIAIPGLDWKAGTFTEQFEDKPLVIPITPEMVAPLKDEKGAIIAGQIDLGDTAYIWNGKELVKRINPYDGTPLNNKWEDQAFLANPANVDGTVKEFNFDVMTKPFISRNAKDIEHPFYEFNGIKIPSKRYGFGDNVVPESDGKGGYVLKDTCVYTIFETLTTPSMYVVNYWGIDHKLHQRMGYGDVAPDVDAYHSDQMKNPANWNPYYQDHQVKW